MKRNNPQGFKMKFSHIASCDPKVMTSTGRGIVVHSLIQNGDLTVFPGRYFVNTVFHKEEQVEFKARVLPGHGRGFFYLPVRHPAPVEKRKNTTGASLPY